MTSVTEDTDWMPATLRVAFTLLGAITVLAAIPLLGAMVFIGTWSSGWTRLLTLFPIAGIAVLVSITVLVMTRHSWARYATVIFPASIVVAVVAMVGSPDAVPVLLLVLALSVIAVILLFVPSSRAYFTHPSELGSATDAEK
ncbi:hypothetical protein AB0N61_03285 [Microbacterium sp. NPDC089320]|uniref:hypothetical protein n=1 Tax=Microbacterium sp. NPDC089320 TaxID=3155182 RepID=UPI00344985DF